MDDRRGRFAALILAAGLLCAAQSGCIPLSVMAGKMLFGDPMFTSAFKQQTGVDLAKQRKKVLLVCTTPESIKAEIPSLDYDLTEGMARQLMSRGIAVVDRNRVADWLDDNGGVWGSADQLAVAGFDADYIIHADLERFRYRDPRSPGLFQGHVSGAVWAYEIRDVDGRRRALQVFEWDFRSVYPQHQPYSVDDMSPRMFQQKYVDRISRQLAQLFHDHRLAETIE